jgi:hypothetical protein
MQFMQKFGNSSSSEEIFNAIIFETLRNNQDRKIVR